jgi:putative PIG3 family NAD(P)H quinone oxidoreductase
MRAVTIERPGGPAVLTWADVPDPECGPGQVVIDVVAGAVNRADLAQREGNYPPPPGAPEYPGLECSGRIAEVGAGVTGWRVGDEVCALLGGGGYAEKVAVDAGSVVPVPAGVGLADAAALPEVAGTVWSNVFQIARLAAGETFLVHGGASGIGTFAIQLARARGAVPYATARAGKHGALRELGVERAIDYTAEDFVAAVREATGGRGVDVVLDIIGAAYLERNLTALAPNGRLAVIGFQGGRKAELDLSLMMTRRASVSVTSLRYRPAAEKAAIMAEVREQVWPLVAAGAVRPVIDQRVPMADAARAHRLMESGDHVGKILLVRE